jgi:hypothetical protein
MEMFQHNLLTKLSRTACRDKGWMRMMGGGLVLVPRCHMIRRESIDAEGSHSDEDRHKAPASTLLLPLSLQFCGANVSYMPVFGRQNSSER